MDHATNAPCFVFRLLTTSEQIELLRSLAPSLRHSEVLWIAGGLHFYGSLEERNGSLTFEELAEALVHLARVRGTEASEGGEGQQGGLLTRQQQQQPSAGTWTGQQRQGWGEDPHLGTMSGPAASAPYGGWSAYGSPNGMMASGPLPPHGMMNGPWAGSMTASGSPGGGGLGGWSSLETLSPTHPGVAREAGTAYFAWVHDNRQKVLER